MIRESDWEPDRQPAVGNDARTSNAYYSEDPERNVLPAAIMQPPGFDVNATDAVNYGAIGVVVSGMRSHGFDGRKERKFAGRGRMRGKVDGRGQERS